MRILDLFCGAGGAAMGYHRAGFEVIGIDVKKQRHYPFDFLRYDALEFLREWQSRPTTRSMFDAIHASPPCQNYSQATLALRQAGKAYPDLLSETRVLLEATGLPWIIENVPGSPMRADACLCGCMFGLKELRRRRWFECSWHPMILHPRCIHDPKIQVITVIGSGGQMGGSWGRYNRRSGNSPVHKSDWERAMGINWMSNRELSQAIPPAYTEFMGRVLMQHLQRTPAHEQQRPPQRPLLLHPEPEPDPPEA